RARRDAGDDRGACGPPQGRAALHARRRRTSPALSPEHGGPAPPWHHGRALSRARERVPHAAGGWRPWRGTFDARDRRAARLARAAFEARPPRLRPGVVRLARTYGFVC